MQDSNTYPYPLHIVCSSSMPDCIQLVEMYLKQGMDINAFNEKQITPLQFAIHVNNVGLVEYLLENNADPNLTSIELSTPLAYSIELNHMEIFYLLLKHEKTDVNARDRNNWTALYTAVLNGNDEAVKALLKHGVDQTIGDASGQCPLHIAIALEHLNILKMLLEANPELINSSKFLHRGLSLPLQAAAFNGKLEAAKVLVEYKADVNLFFTLKTPALLGAAEKGHAQLVQFLLDKGAQPELSGLKDSVDTAFTPLRQAAAFAHIECVEILLKYPHSGINIFRSMNNASCNALTCTDKEKRAKLYTIVAMVKAAYKQYQNSSFLKLQNGKPKTWELSFKTLFKQDPGEQDKNPRTRDAAICKAIAAMEQLLHNPEACIPYIQFLSNELEKQWKKEHEGNPFPKFDRSGLQFVSHYSSSWPIPNERYQDIEKFSLLGRIILDKFQQYGMGNEQTKWTGFIPKLTSKKLLLANEFFTENRLTINGLFHGNMHNVQRFILLLAMEEGVIPTHYQSDNGQQMKLDFKDIFSALMRTDLSPSGKRQNPRWGKVLDVFNRDYVTFSHPHRLQSILLTDPACSGVFQEYMLFSFCNKYNQLRELHNHVYGTNYNNLEFWEEINSLQFELFIELAEFALQLDETKNIKEVARIDEMISLERKWAVQPKHYAPLLEKVGIFGKQPEESGPGSIALSL